MFIADTDVLIDFLRGEGEAKRIELETQGTLTLGSVKCPQGKEEELLAGLPELAQKLMGIK